MARCSPLCEVAAANVAEAEDVGRVEGTMEVAWMIGGCEVLSASGDKGGSDDSLDGGGSDNENSRTYNFRASTITLGHIKEMVDKGYFVDGEARAPRVEAMPELDDDGAVVYEDFFRCQFAHAFASCFTWHFVEVSGIAPPTYAQRDSASVEIFLGCRQLRGRTFSQCVYKMVHAALSA
jgi:hypothetical protein